MGRTVIVTGGTGGLGGPVVQRMLDDGWRVVVPRRAGRERERTGERDGLALVEADLFDPRAVADVVALATAEPDAPLRAAVNLVGGFAAGGRVGETPVEDFERLFRLNLRPLYLVSAATAPLMAEDGGGAVVAVSARAALRPFSGAAGYISSKAAVIAFIGALDAEYRDEGVRSNAILPSVIDTPGNRASQPDADHSRWVSPERIAGVVAFLCSEDSAPTSGAAIPVYGRA